MAFGMDAQADHDHSFVFGDGSVVTSSTGVSSFVVRASGGLRFFTGSTTGVEIAPGSGTWSVLRYRDHALFPSQTVL